MELYFEQNVLEEARYYAASEKQLRIARRSAYFTYQASPFRWCATVAALSLALIRAKELYLSNRLYEPLLVGSLGTPAHTFSKAAYSSTLWIWDLFGTTAEGRSRLFNIFHFVNPKNRGHLGPSKVFYMGNYLPPGNIRIFKDNAELNSEGQLVELRESIQVGYNALILNRIPQALKTSRISSAVEFIPNVGSVKP